MEQQDKSELRLSDDQLAEVRRRRAKNNPQYISPMPAAASVHENCF
jgi:hypothetical protein